jgi:hypothetical protein
MLFLPLGRGTKFRVHMKQEVRITSVVFVCLHLYITILSHIVTIPVQCTNPLIVFISVTPISSVVSDV